jgi:hypothetical protein
MKKPRVENSHATVPLTLKISHYCLIFVKQTPQEIHNMLNCGFCSDEASNHPRKRATEKSTKKRTKSVSNNNNEPDKQTKER